MSGVAYSYVLFSRAANWFFLEILETTTYTSGDGDRKIGLLLLMVVK